MLGFSRFLCYIYFYTRNFIVVCICYWICSNIHMASPSLTEKFWLIVVSHCLPNRFNRFI